MIDYFHQADDPYSHLAAQLLVPLRQRYGVDVRCWLVPAPDDAAAPERERLRAYALRDAPRVAAAYGLSFPANATQPSADAVTTAERALAPHLASDDFADRAAAVGHALWTGASIEAESAAPGADQSLSDGAAERSRLGHYLGGMFHYDGMWFWGVDRLSYLEAKLAAEGRDRAAGQPPLAPWRDMRLGPTPAGGREATIEMWFSFRSPYSWIAFPRVRRLAAHYGARLELRPILPMVMRGLPVPPVKGYYIVRDVRREADRLGLPFGPVSDPVGPGAERALAVVHHAIPLGLGEAFTDAAFRAAWTEGVALASDEGLLSAARRAGLTDAQVAAALADESWRVAAEANRVSLFDAGLWGAPSYRVEGGPAHWGQDRLWALEEDLVAALS